MSAYIRSLQQIQPAPTCEASPPSLEARFIHWFNGLPQVTRHRPFSMREFEVALGTQGRHLSAVLLRLSWSRARHWQSRQSYCRVWLPPGLSGGTGSPPEPCQQNNHIARMP